VACFVRPADNLTISATNLSKPIHNLDLVLVEMRGDLFRFVSSSRTTLVINNTDDPRRAYIFTDMPYKVLACPVFQGIEMPAMLVLLNHDSKPDFSNSDRRLGEVMAHQIANVMHMQGMFAEMRRFTEQMAAALIEAVEAKDPYTRGHSERVHLLSMRLGQGCACAPKRWRTCTGAPAPRRGQDRHSRRRAVQARAPDLRRIHLHQGPPRALLRDPAPRGPPQGCHRRRPPSPGKIRWHRLSPRPAGHQHPLLARIIAVADTYDSITSSRAYRAGSTHEAAVKEMTRVSGTQLDPELLDVFLRICDDDPALLVKLGVRRSGTIAKDIVRTRAGTLTYLAPKAPSTTARPSATWVRPSRPASPAMNCGWSSTWARSPCFPARPWPSSSPAVPASPGWRLAAPQRAQPADRRHPAGHRPQPSPGDLRQRRPRSHRPVRAADQRCRRLGDLLIERGLATPEQLAEAARLQGQLGLRIGRILIEKGWVPEHELLQALSAQLDVPYLAMRPGLFDPSIAEALPQDMARRLGVLPMFRVGNELTLATTDPQSMPVADEIERASGCRLRWVLAAADAIQKSLFEAYSGSAYDPDLIDGNAMDLELIDNANRGGDATTIDELAAGSPVINLVNSIIQRAIHDNASDIHLELFRAKARVRFRIDGVLYEVMNPRPTSSGADLASQGDGQPGHRRAPPAPGRPHPGVHQGPHRGPALLVPARHLRRKGGPAGARQGQHRPRPAPPRPGRGQPERFRRLLARSHGLLLVTGPTGSGKTTTLYGAIDHLRSIEKNIVTIEDPVEYQLDIINQNQVNEAVGLTFPRILRHVLRQDPDIIMVGEIRDRQTAEIAVQAALTGHLVLSTCTPTTPSAPSRGWWTWASNPICCRRR
jgi:hypothetical protein